MAFALSIHKNQSSEYQQVNIVLDHYVADFINPLVTQALIYTAITRAKTSLTIHANQRLLEQVLQQKAEKNSPLAALLADKHKVTG